VWFAGWTVAAAAAVLVQWPFMLVAGRAAVPLHRFVTRYLNYWTHLQAYLYLLANPFPRFLGRPGRYPVDLVVPAPAAQPRWKTLLRPVLAVPAWVFAQVLVRVAEIVAVAGWFVCLTLGRMPRGMRDLGAYCLRYGQQTEAYLLLLTDRYPSLATAETYIEPR
jgi:Domain of unknown function (DUF4389)